MTDTRLRVGLVGAGPWAHKVHAPGIAAHSGTELAAVWARRPEAAAAVASLGSAAQVDTFEDLLATVDAVTFAVPPAVQGPLALRAAQAGKHVILEKPIAETVAEAETLVDAIERAGVASLMMLTFRYARETVKWLTQVHRTGGWEGGAARWMSASLLDTKYADSRWRHDGGALADIGPHVFDMLDAALGEITEVLAAHRTGQDLWHVLLGHEGGRTSVSTLTMRTPATPPINDFTVHGTNGYLTFDGSGSPQDRYANLLDEFVALITASRAEHPLDARRGLHIQRVLEKITTSVRTTS